MSVFNWIPIKQINKAVTSKKDHVSTLIYSFWSLYLFLSRFSCISIVFTVSIISKCHVRTYGGLWCVICVFIFGNVMFFFCGTWSEIKSTEVKPMRVNFWDVSDMWLCVLQLSVRCMMSSNMLLLLLCLAAVSHVTGKNMHDFVPSAAILKLYLNL